MKVREIREKKNIKQKDMAKLLGISKGNYSKKETGLIKFSLKEAKKISDYLDESIYELFFE